MCQNNDKEVKKKLRIKWDINLVNEWVKNNKPEWKCLSTEYTNNRTKMLWKGPNSIIKTMSFADFIHCKHITIRWDIDLIRNWLTLNEPSWKLKSDEYINSGTKLLWECPEGHERWIPWESFKDSGCRCSKCYGKEKLEFIDVKNYIESFEGWICHSTEYNGDHKYLDLECPRGHKMRMSLNNFKRGNRCNICYRNNNFGSNHWSYNPNRISMNKYKEMHRKSTPSKRSFRKLNNKPEFKNMEIDHIISVKMLVDLGIDDRNVINCYDNYQFLTKKENRNKSDKCTIEDALKYLITKDISPKSVYDKLINDILNTQEEIFILTGVI